MFWWIIRYKKNVSKFLSFATSTLTDLNPDELRFYPFFLSLDSFDGGYITADDPNAPVFASNKVQKNVKIFYSRSK